MPQGDGTGPVGRPDGNYGQGQGWHGGGQGGPGGECVCPSCGATIPHQAGTPCTAISCPKCGTRMIRK